MNRERLADAAVTGSWLTTVGLTMAQVNAVLTALSLIAATVASICAAIYYIRRSKP